MRMSGHILTTDTPVRRAKGTGPQSLLSMLWARLSPNTMHSSVPTSHDLVFVPGSAGSPPRYGSGWCRPLMCSRPHSKETLSPGRPTIRLTCHPLPGSPGGLSMTTSPRCGSRRSLVTSSTSPSESEGSILDPRTTYIKGLKLQSINADAPLTHPWQKTV